MAFVQPFDFQTIFLDYFAGSIEIFFLIGLFVIAIAAIKFKMNLTMSTYFVIIFTLILNGYALYQGAVSPLLLLFLVVAVIIGIPIIMREVLKS